MGSLTRFFWDTMEHFGHVTSTTTPVILPPSSTVKCSNAASDRRPRTERLYGAEPRHTLESGARLSGLTRYRRQSGLIHHRANAVSRGDEFPQSCDNL